MNSNKTQRPKDQEPDGSFYDFSNSHEKQNAVNTNGWQRFLWWLSAADPVWIEKSGPDRFRFTIIGYAVGGTWLFATLSWFYFFSTMLQDGLAIGACALFFGWIILTIDRGLIAGMTGSSKWKIFPLLLRSALALTIGFFLSQPVVLWLFKKDVDSYLPVLQQERTAEHQIQIRKAYQSALDFQQNEINRIRKEWMEKESAIAALQQSYLRETDGTGGSGKIGASTIAQIKKTTWLKNEDDFLTWKRQQQPLLDSSTERLQRLEREISAKVNDFNAQQNDGFLTRIETLDKLMEKHPPIQNRYRLVVLIIVLIELMPLLTKLLLPVKVYDTLHQQSTEDFLFHQSWIKSKSEKLEKSWVEQAQQMDERWQSTVLNKMQAWREEEAEKAFKNWQQNQATSLKGFWQHLKKNWLFLNQK